MRSTITFLLSITCSSAFAAGTLMEAFDFARCQMWRLDDERIHYTAPPSPERQGLIDETLRQARSMQLRTALISGDILKVQRRSTDQDATVGSVHCVVAEPMNIERYASYVSTLTCFASVGDYSQQSVYRARKKDTANWSPATYECAPDCSAYSVHAVYELPWEDGRINHAHSRRSRAFSSQCKR